ncbi:MAG: M48 family metalloprotease [Terriglobia bacterium]
MLRSLALRLIGLWFIVVVPVTMLGASREKSLPDGVCGDSQTMLEASQAGNAMIRQVLAAGMSWNERGLNEYVNRLGQNLARTSGSQQVFAFYVLYNPAVNAEAFPGGYIVINSGAISLAESEAELASVLSHEIAHENSCDWRTAPRKGNLFELICVVPTMVLGGPAGIAIAAGGGWAATAARARSRRADEERADRLAAQYLVRAGYDPHAAAQFFMRLQAEQGLSGREPSGLLATHPRTADRRKQLEKIIPSLPPPESAPHDEAEFLRMRRAVREYDEMYSRIVGVHVPGRDVPPPELSHRISANVTPFIAPR